jgi:hypothetical protein
MADLKVGHSRCKCPACGNFFNSAAAFDKHRVGSHSEGRSCLGEDGMKAIGMDTNLDGYWVTSLRPLGMSFSDEED